MKLITKTTYYWIFEKTSNDPNNKYSYIRCQVEGLSNVSWFVGYENASGFVNSVGPMCSEELSAELEKRFLNAPVESK
jgi:hypothetical protein